jgi:hypothetical protein
VRAPEQVMAASRTFDHHLKYVQRVNVGVTFAQPRAEVGSKNLLEFPCHQILDFSIHPSPSSPCAEISVGRPTHDRLANLVILQSRYSLLNGRQGLDVLELSRRQVMYRCIWSLHSPVESGMSEGMEVRAMLFADHNGQEGRNRDLEVWV